MEKNFCYQKTETDERKQQAVPSKSFLPKKLQLENSTKELMNTKVSKRKFSDMKKRCTDTRIEKILKRIEKLKNNKKNQQLVVKPKMDKITMKTTPEI